MAGPGLGLARCHLPTGRLRHRAEREAWQSGVGRAALQPLTTREHGWDRDFVFVALLCVWVGRPEERRQLRGDHRATFFTVSQVRVVTSLPNVFSISVMK